MLPHKAYLAITFVIFSTVVSGRPLKSSRQVGASTYPVTLINNCEYTIWPAASQWNRFNAPESEFPLIDSKQTGLGPLKPGGTSTPVEVPTKWLGGRFWARTDCKTGTGDVCCISDICGRFDSRGVCKASLVCGTGDCDGQADCGSLYWKTQPTLWIELGYGANTFPGGTAGISADISRIQGFNVPVRISDGEESRTCADPNCPTSEAFVHEGEDDAKDGCIMGMPAAGAAMTIEWCPSVGN